MAQLVVRNLEEDVKERLRRRAKTHGRSMEAEVREILQNALKDDRAASVGLGSRLQTRFAGIGFEHEIEELHGEEARPADLDE